MDLDLAKLAKDKRVWLAGAGAVALGLFAYVRRSKSGAGTAPSPSGAPTYAGVQGGVDTTGTDIAAFLGQYNSAVQGQLTDFGQQLTGIADAVKNIPPANQPSSPSSGAPTTFGVSENRSDISAITRWLNDRGWNGTWYQLWNANQGVWSNNTTHAFAPVGTTLKVPTL